MGEVCSRIGSIAVHLPERAETNDQLQRENPKWDMPLIEEKLGIRTRYIAREDETAADLGVLAAQRLFAECGVDRQEVDFLLLCTQTPDYPLPTTACLMQDRLQLRTNIGAIDFNLGCSGFVYGLGIADGLIRSGSARKVLLITAETYSKYIGPDDRSLRPIFGDGAAATIVEAVPVSKPGGASLSAFTYGTDGAGANMLLVNCGGARAKEQAIQPSKRHRWSSPLCMDGPALIDFTLSRVPAAVDDVLTRSGLAESDIDLYLVHQASAKLLQHLRERLGVDERRMPTCLADYGNTVSSTLPIMIRDLRRDGRLKPGMKSILIGFGVGLSWSACLWVETQS